MSFAEMTLPEFDQEMATTRRVLERLPEDKLDWQPHPKSHTIGWNANHIAEIAGWGESICNDDDFDMHPPGGVRYTTPTLATRQAILDSFDQGVAATRAALAQVKDESLGDIWSLLDAGKPVLQMPRGAMFRTFVLSHLIHHRAILTVYYRLNDISVPGCYGPSGDE